MNCLWTVGSALTLNDFKQNIVLTSQIAVVGWPIDIVVSVNFFGAPKLRSQRLFFGRNVHIQLVERSKIPSNGNVSSVLEPLDLINLHTEVGKLCKQISCSCG